MECVAGPTAAFTVSPTSGTAPLSVRVTGSATPGSAAIASVRYNFGVGAGLETDAVHTYTSSGMFTITQRVVDTNGIVATTTRSVMVDPATFTPVRLSTTDRSPSPAMELTADRLGMEVITGSPAGVRSDRAIMPGSGMFYYEGERLTSLVGQMRFGVATAAVPLGSQLGATTQSVSVETVGSVYYDGAFVESFPASVNQDYGIVVDYRGTHPIVHVIVRATNPATFAIEDRVHASVTMSAVTAPLYIMLSGGRRRVGPQARINPGNDTTNFPFHYNVVTLLNRAGLAGSALVRGWGQTQARPANDAPIISTSADRTVPVGTPVTVTATATDAEDGTLTPSIAWQDLASIYGSRVTGAGGSFTVTPTTVGIHPLEARVTDATGQTTIQVVDVTVTGAIPQFDPVRLVPDSRSGPGILLSADGLSARFTGVGKYGIRANQGMRGAFQYFETRRLIAPGNQGSGLVVGDGHLDPYDAITVPPSVSINHGNGVWRSIIYEDDYDVAATTYYGFAVDYRGRHPIVYVIARDGVSASDVVAHRFVLDDVTTPIYPMAYGNPISPSGFDTRINFGATAFNYDPAAVLGTAGYSAAGLELGWGDANTP
jgi:PKD repeat protein